MTEKQVEYFQLYQEGLTTTQIAKKFGVSVSSVSRTLYRARRAPVGFRFLCNTSNSCFSCEQRLSCESESVHIKRNRQTIPTPQDVAEKGRYSY